MSYSKIITLDDHFSTGEPTVQLVSAWGRGGKLLREATSLHKIASTHSPAVDYIKTVAPEPGKTIVLVIGLGDNETYGANRNGDGFPSQPVKGKIAPDEVLTKHYQSYDKAHVFEHHVNSDPAKAIGRVKKAFWNPHMRRVEMVEDFDNAKAPHLLEKIASGAYPAKSMGCRIKYDVCNNCGNKAKTRADYCDHLKFAMSRIDPHSGVQNSALNPSPDFFDSSWVLRPADRTGFMMKKVAKEHPYELRMGGFELGDLINDLSSKSAELGKAADIEKVMQGAPAASVSNLKPKDARLVEKYMSDCGCNASNDDATHDRTVSIMISYKPSEALDSADEMELPLGIKDIIQYFLGKIAPETAGADKRTLKSANDHLGLIYSIYSKYPRFYSDLVKEAGLDVNQGPNAQLMRKLAAETPTTDYVKRHVLPEAFYPGRAKTDMVSWTDPNSGQQYETNYGAVQATHDPLIHQGLEHKALAGGALLGTGALLGGAAYATRNTRLPSALKWGAGLVGAGLGAAGAHTLLNHSPVAGPKVVTDQGETISGWTPMAPVRGKYGEATLVNFPYIVKRANEAPNAMRPQYVDWFIDQLKSAEIHDELSPYIGPTLDLDKVAQALGTSILKRAE